MPCGKWEKLPPYALLQNARGRARGCSLLCPGCSAQLLAIPRTAGTSQVELPHKVIIEFLVRENPGQLLVHVIRDEL
eukprot:7883347-Alexandrium_andersonii.AAC.1